MQTKNVNVTPLNNTIHCTTEVDEMRPPLPGRMRVAGSNPSTNSATPTTTGGTSMSMMMATSTGGLCSGSVSSSPYKPAPPPKPLPGGRHSPPPYRMPPYPLYSEPQLQPPPGAIPGASTTTTTTPGGHHNNTPLHTHSSKFPIEREVILGDGEKNSKIPILNEYTRRRASGKGSVAVAPDAPSRQVAWVVERERAHNNTPLTTTTSYQQAKESFHDATLPGHHIYKVGSMAQPMRMLDSSQGSEPSPIGSTSRDRIDTTYQARRLAHSTPEEAMPDNSANNVRGGSGGKAFPTRTYHTIRDMISSRFNRRLEGGAVSTPGGEREEGELQQQNVEALSPQSQLRQRGVYLAPTPTPTPTSVQQRNRAAINNPTPATASEVMRRNQEIRMQLERERTGQQQQQQQQQLYREVDIDKPHGHGVYGVRSLSSEVQSPVESWRGVEVQERSASRAGAGKRNGERENGEEEGQDAVEDEEGEEGYLDEEGGRGKGGRVGSGGGHHSDSGRGSTVYSSGKRSAQGRAVKATKGQRGHGQRSIRPKNEGEASTNPPTGDEGGMMGNERGDCQWVDTVETELRQILEQQRRPSKCGGGGGSSHSQGGNSTLSESVSSVTPPLPPLSPCHGHGSTDDDEDTPGTRNTPYGFGKHKAKGNKLRGMGMMGVLGGSSAGGRCPKEKCSSSTSHHRTSNKRETPSGKLQPSGLMCSSSLELDSMLEENNSSDETSTADTRAIRKQLEGLETMYSEVLKLLGVGVGGSAKKGGVNLGKGYQASDPRVHRRRVYGSLSSLPSSVSSRPTLRHGDKRLRHHHDDTRKKVKDIKSINKRFQRLESHVVTLARSVAHLSSEMRTQHLMIQEMEVIRGELAALRSQAGAAAAAASVAVPRSQSLPRALNGPGGGPPTHPRLGMAAVDQVNSTPDRVKRLTKFFGDEPPLMRLFLRKLGYEKYAGAFESERIGLVELPYLSEERLHKLGIPLGPRLRILQEARAGVGVDNVNTLCVV